MRNMSAVARFTFLIVAIMAVAVTRVTFTLGLEEEKLQSPIIGDVDKNIRECWAAIVGVEGCVSDLIKSFSSLQIKLDPGCCNAIAGIGEHCFKAIFANFGPSFAPLLKSFCDAIPGTNPLPVIAPAPLDH